MFSPFARRVGVCLFALATVSALPPAALAAPASAPASLPSLESFFGSSPFSGAVLSPDGLSLAVTISPKDKRKGLYVIDLATNKGSVVAQFSDADIDSVRWVNNQRILFDTGDSQLGQRDLTDSPGLFAVNRDGSQMRQLAAYSAAYYGSGARQQSERNLLPPSTFMTSQVGAQDSDFVYVESLVWATDGETRTTELLRLNTVTGVSTKVKRPPGVMSWLLDNKGEPRIAMGRKDAELMVYYRENPQDDWTLISSGDLFGLKKASFEPLAFGPNNTVYVKTNKGDKDEVYIYDYKTNKLSDTPFISTAGYDFSGQLVSHGEKVAGMVFSTDALSSMWFDPVMKELQARIDGLLTSTVNIVSVGARSKSPWAVVMSYSDVQPPIYNLFNRETGQFQKIGESRPGIDPAQMGSQQQITFKARDGMDIPALLTLPKGKSKDLPLVVLVHGGPWVRGSMWGWDAESQFLASRGYAVIEPSYRGTTGFGKKLARAGYRQWGLAMQDDIADSAKWAIASGYANAKRVCIAGASYGGYATLMGLINDHDLYQCGVSWVGVTDIELFAKGHWSFKSDMTSLFLDNGFGNMIGDVVKDAAQLKATSPLVQAARVRRPVLMAYGGVDARVPRFHGELFYKAVKPTNPDVELIIYPEEGHGFFLPKNRYDFYGRMEKFLEKHIGRP